MNEIYLCQAEDGKFREYEPYCTIDCMTEDEYNSLIDAVEFRREHCWRSVEAENPPADETVFVIVNGKYGRTSFENSVMLAAFVHGEGWIIAGYEDWADPEVTHWAKIPWFEGWTE